MPVDSKTQRNEHRGSGGSDVSQAEQGRDLAQEGMRRSSEADLLLLARLGGELVRIRTMRKLSQASLGAMTRLHVNTISSVERGRTDPSIFVLGLICLGLGCPRIELSDEGLFPVMGSDAGLPPYALRSLFRKPGAMAAHSAGFSMLRASSGMSIRGLAASAGVHPNTVWNYETGRTAPSVTVAFRIYLELGIRSIGGSGDIRTDRHNTL